MLTNPPTSNARRRSTNSNNPYNPYSPYQSNNSSSDSNLNQNNHLPETNNSTPIIVTFLRSVFDSIVVEIWVLFCVVDYVLVKLFATFVKLEEYPLLLGWISFVFLFCLVFEIIMKDILFFYRLPKRMGDVFDTILVLGSFIGELLSFFSDSESPLANVSWWLSFLVAFRMWRMVRLIHRARKGYFTIHAENNFRLEDIRNQRLLETDASSSASPSALRKNESSKVEIDLEKGETTPLSAQSHSVPSYQLSQQTLELEELRKKLDASIQLENELRETIANEKLKYEEAVAEKANSDVSDNDRKRIAELESELEKERTRVQELSSKAAPQHSLEQVSEDSKLKPQLEKLQKTEKELRETIATMKKNHEEALAEKDKANTSVQDKKRISELEKELEKEKKVQELNSTASQSRSLGQQASSEENKLKSQIEELQNIEKDLLAKLEQEKKLAEKKLQEAIRLREAEEKAKIAQLEKSFAEEKKKSSQISEVGELKKQLEKVTSSEKELRERIENEKKDFEMKLQTAIQNKETEHKTKITQLEKIVSEERKGSRLLSPLESPQVTSRNRSQSASPFVVQPQLIEEIAQKELEKQKNQYEDLERKRRQVSEKHNELKREKENVSQTLESIKEQLSQEEKTLEEIKSKESALAEKKKELRRLVSHEEADISQLKNQIRYDSRRLQREQSTTGSQIGRTPDLNPRSFEEISWSSLDVGKQIGTGAFALVYEAFRAGERVAVKKFLAQSEEARKEMMSEVSVMAQLHSGYVVSFYGASFVSPDMCITMEFITRGSLFFLLSDDSVELPWDLRWSIVHDAALGINYLHSKRPALLHRDMKSGNLLVSEDWRVKVCDFGQSEHGERAPEANEGAGGTARWTAPEVIKGDTYTEASDVYSYGIIMWEVATRKIPFDDVSTSTLNDSIISGSRPPEPRETPSPYISMMKRCWDPVATRRPLFPEIVDWYTAQGKGVEEEKLQYKDNSPRSVLADIEQKCAEMKSRKDKLEREWESFEKRSERERENNTLLESQKDAIELKYNQEKRKTTDLERQLESVQRRVAQEKQLAQEQEEKRQKKDQKKGSHRQSAVDNLTQERDASQQRYLQEKEKTEKAKARLAEIEKQVEEERAKRIEAERERDLARR